MSSRLDRIQDWEEQARKAGYRASEMSRFVSVSDRHLRRHFLTVHGLPPQEWIDRLRQKNRESMVRKQEETRYDSDTTEDALVVAEDMIAGQVRQERMSETFAQLSELCRQLLRMLSDGIAPRDAAEQLQMNSVDTLYRRKNACTERWREVYREIG